MTADKKAIDNSKLEILTEEFYLGYFVFKIRSLRSSEKHRADLYTELC